MGALRVILICCLLYGKAQAKQEPKPIYEGWRFVTTRDGGERESKQVKSYYVRRTGKDIVLKDERTRVETKGVVTDGKVEFTTIVPRNGEETKVKWSLDGDPSKGMLSISKNIVIDGHDVKVTTQVTRLASVWACDNHSPIHSALTSAQMKALTKTEKCTGWHRVTGTSADEALKAVFDSSPRPNVLRP